MTRILLLAGTGDARRLAGALAPDHDIVASLAGATRDPAEYPCLVRTGGFGGAAGLAAFLREGKFEAMIDATHPFAARISANAVAAAANTDTPLIRIARPAWAARPGERWIDAPNMDAAARALPPGARAFLAVGKGSLAAFATRTDIRLFLRTVDRPEAPFPGVGDYIVARPPFDEAAERALLLRLGVTHLVVKNAGGDAGRTKLDAAAALGLPVIVVRRPDEPDAAPATPPEHVSAWLAALARPR